MALRLAGGASRVQLPAFQIPNTMSLFLLCRPLALPGAAESLWGSIENTTTNTSVFRWMLNGTGANMRLFVKRATTDTSVISSNNPVVLNTWCYLGLSFDFGATPSTHLYYGTLTTPMAECTYGTNTSGAGAIVAQDGIHTPSWGARKEAGNVTSSINADYATGQYYPRVLSLNEFLQLQQLARNLVGIGTFHHFGVGGTGTQPDLSGNVQNGVVTSGTQQLHPPININNAGPELDEHPYTYNPVFGIATSLGPLQVSATASVIAQATIATSLTLNVTGSAIVRSANVGTLYVDTVAGSDTIGDGGILRPFKTMAKALSLGSDIRLVMGSEVRENLNLLAPQMNVIGLWDGIGQKPRITATDKATGFTPYTGTAWRGTGVPWTLPTNVTNNATGRTIRLVIPPNTMKYVGGRIRLWLKAQASLPCTLIASYIGVQATQGAGVQPYDIQAGTLSQITWNGGQAGITVPAGGNLPCDDFPIAIDHSLTYVVSYSFSGPNISWGSGSVNTATGNNPSSTYYNATAPGSAVSALSLPAGYANVIDIYGFQKLEIEELFNPINLWTSAFTLPPSTVWFDDVTGVPAATLGAAQSTRSWYWNGGTLYVYSAVAPGLIEGAVRQTALTSTNVDDLVLRNIRFDGGIGDSLAVLGGLRALADGVIASKSGGYGIRMASPNGRVVGGEVTRNVLAGALADAPNVSLDIYAHDNTGDGWQASTFATGTLKGSGKWNNNGGAGYKIAAGATPVLALSRFESINNTGRGGDVGGATGGVIANGFEIGNQAEALAASGASTFDIVNVVAVANGIKDVVTDQVANNGSGVVTRRNSALMPNSRVIDTHGLINTTAGAGNVPTVGAFIHRRRPFALWLTIDDYGSYGVADVIFPYAAARGIHMTWGINTKDATKSSVPGGGWAKVRAAHDAGHYIACHSRSHPNLTDVNFISIRYTGAAASATVAISGNVLSTYLNGSGTPDHTVNLATVTNDAMQTLVATINTWANYTATLIAITSLNTSPTSLADLAPADIKTAARTLVIDQTRYWNDEIVGAKADIEANIPGYTCEYFITPYNGFDAGVVAAIQAAGFKANRNGFPNTGPLGARSPLLDRQDLFDLWGAVASINMPGSTDVAGQTAALVEYLGWMGGLYCIYAHDASTYSIANWQILIDTVVAARANVLRFPEAIDFLKATNTTTDGRVYTHTWPSAETFDYSPLYPSPLIDAGAIVAGVTDGYLGTAPDIGETEVRYSLANAALSFVLKFGRGSRRMHIATIDSAPTIRSRIFQATDFGAL